MWFYWLSPYRIMFLMLSPFGITGLNSLLCFEISEVLEVPSSTAWGDRSQGGTGLSLGDMQSFSGCVLEANCRVEGWILPWLISVLKQSTPFALCPVHLCVFRLTPPVSLCFISWWVNAGARGNKHGVVQAPNTYMPDSRPCCAVKVIYLLPKRPCRTLARPVPVNCACLSL